MASYKFEDGAARDLDDIYRYGAKTFGETRADAFFMKFLDHFCELAARPLSCPVVLYLDGDYRRSVFQKHSSYYRLTDDGIQIAAIIGRQDTASRFQ